MFARNGVRVGNETENKAGSQKRPIHKHRPNAEITR
jgi:hypothetical protein